MAVKFGRRPVYLLSNFLMGIACIWLAIATEKTFLVFVLARAFLGFFEAPIEAIVPSTIADIFYLHERGEKIALYGLSVLGGNELGPLFSAYIIDSLSMKWAFFVIAIAIGVNLIMMIFLMPETMFGGHRPVIGSVQSQDSKHEEGINSSSQHVEAAEQVSGESLAAMKRPYWQDLFQITVNREINLWIVFKRPIILMAYPTVLWSSLVYGMSLSWNVILGSVVAQVFSPP
jgi:MFS family permease